jgi:hypothetical protein
MIPFASAIKNFCSLIHSASMAGVEFQQDNWQVYRNVIKMFNVMIDKVINELTLSNKLGPK